MGSLRLGLIVLLSLSAVWAAEKKDTSSPLVNVLLCPLRAEAWDCVRQQAGRMLLQLDEQLTVKSEELKAQADAEMVKKLEARGFSASDVNPREKPSSVMLSMEETLDSLTDGVEALISTRNDAVEEEEEEEEDLDGEEKKKDKKKTKKKKKPTSNDDHHHHEESDEHELVDWEVADDHEIKHGHKHGQNTQDVLPVEEAIGHEDANADKEVESGRSNGEVRGKKKKKKKAIMKLLVLGAVMKGKIEMLLKILSFHLQLKFFAIAVLGLLINLARFWVDVKKSHHPQKVIYYEHAQHQHHYDDHGEDGWGGYWKRSLNLANEPAPTDDATYYSTNHYNGPARVARSPAADAAHISTGYAQDAVYKQGPSSFGDELAYRGQVPHSRYA